MKTFKIALMGSVTVAAASLCSAAAQAQLDGSAAPAAAEQQSERVSDQGGVEEIVVTAQRRQENVQRASLSIAAISADTLNQRGVRDSQSLNGIVPGLKIGYTSGQVQVFIRGVGDISVNSYTQPSVALNLDGVNLARSSAFGPIFFDTARVEVLRGPQGTLYGRNASGGAINVISNAPNLDAVSGYAVAEAGNYDLRRLQTAVNLPLSETFALRAAGQLTHRDGYLSDGSLDDKSQAARVRALWKPNSQLTLNLIGEFAHVGGQGFGRAYRPALFGNPWTGSQDPRLTAAAFPLLFIRYRNDTDVDYWGISGQLDWNLGFATLTVLPAYKHVKNDSLVPGDFLTADRIRSRAKSLEARLGNSGSQLKWVVGAYGFKEDLLSYLVNDQRRAATVSGTLLQSDFPELDSKTGAVFGEATYSLTERLRAIGGVRYTSETRTRNGEVRNFTYANGAVASTVTTPLLNGKTKLSAVTWRGGIEFDVAPASLFYTTVSKGVKSGGFDSTSPSTYDPEYVTAYTVGLKNRLFSNSLQLNLEGFYWKYKDQQVTFLGVDSSGFIALITRNAGQATRYGMSADIAWRPTRQDTLTVGAEYLHAQYDSFRFATLGAFPAGTLLADGCVSDGLAGPGQFVTNCSGKRLFRAPRFNTNIRYTHAFDLGNDNNITVGGTLKHESLAYLVNNYASPNFRQGGYEQYDADVTLNIGTRWSIQAWIRNITDKAVYQSASTEGSIPPVSGPTRGAVSAIGAPRTFGGRVQINF